MKPTILFLFNSSNYAVAPWLADGRFNVVSVDYDETDHSGAHRAPTEGHTVFNIDLSADAAYSHVCHELWMYNMALPSLVVSFAPCTDLAVSGARHFKSKLARDPECQERAVSMAQLASKWGCAYAVENPVSVLATMWRKPDYYWNPCDFAGYIKQSAAEHPEFPGVVPVRDKYNKKSCLWTGGGFRMPEPLREEPGSSINPGFSRLGGKSARTKYIRSLTPRGFAMAVYVANRELVLDNWLGGL